MEVLECTHKGHMTIGNQEIACAVLSDHTRIITQTAMFDVFGRTRKGEQRLEGLPSIIGAKNLLPFVTDELKERLTPVRYFKDSKSTTPSAGHNADVIPLICEVYLNAQDAGILHPSQEKIAIQAQILVRSLAKVGITALIDEATGFQQERESDALQKVLELYIRGDLLRWQTRFPRKFYQEIFRLYNLAYDPLNMKRPSFLGNFTNKYVYSHLPKGVLEELKIKNPKNARGNRSKKHHQLLSGDIGVPHLEKHITKLITIMELSDNIEDFKNNFNKIFRGIEQLPLDLVYPDKKAS